VFSIEAEQISHEAKQPNQSHIEVDPAERFVCRLMESGYSEEIARLSLDHVDQKDIATCNVTKGKHSFLHLLHSLWYKTKHKFSKILYAFRVSNNSIIPNIRCMSHCRID